MYIQSYTSEIVSLVLQILKNVDSNLTREGAKIQIIFLGNWTIPSLLKWYKLFFSLMAGGFSLDIVFRYHFSVYFGTGKFPGSDIKYLPASV